jgi:hypothetical protein
LSGPSDCRSFHVAGPQPSGGGPQRRCSSYCWPHAGGGPHPGGGAPHFAGPQPGGGGPHPGGGAPQFAGPHPGAAPHTTAGRGWNIAAPGNGAGHGPRNAAQAERAAHAPQGNFAGQRPGALWPDEYEHYNRPRPKRPI